VPAEATALERRDGHHPVRLDDGQVVAARTVVVATGARYRYLADRIERSPGIEILRHTEVRDLFVFIGAEPYTRWLGDQLALDDRGFVLSGADARRDAGRPSAHPRIPGGRVDAGDGLTNCLRGSLPSNSPR
jgi:alkyl hydroperoxide reductase subunit AhpF